MMASMAQNYSPHPGGMQPHPGMAQGHPMGVPHNPGQPGQPGQGMPQQMHMGVSGPGPQVSQGGAMMGMPPGAPSQHALQHLNPNQAQQAHMFQQQQMFNPTMQQIQQQQMLQQHQRQQQAARQQMLAQQYSGMPVQMANGMNQITQAQYQAMRGNPMARPVNLPQHLQQQQQQVAEHSMQQQQQQQQAQAQHQQLMMAQQQMALQQQAANAQGGNGPQGQSNQMNSQQPQNNMQAAQAAAMMQQHQHQQQQQQQAHALSQAQQAAQGQAQAQSQAQPGQPNSQGQAPQTQPATQQQQNINQQQAMAAALIQQRQNQNRIQNEQHKFRGQFLIKLMQFGDALSSFGSVTKPLSSYMEDGTPRLAAQELKRQDDYSFWTNFVGRFFSSKGVFRHSLWIVDETSNKQYEIIYPALARYFSAHFDSGIKSMQMTMEKGSETELPNNGHFVECQKSSFIYGFDNGSQLIATGTLKAHFDSEQKIELIEFVTNSHEEFLPRNLVVNAARPSHEWGKEWRSLNAAADGKQSPEMNKKKQKNMKSPQQPPPEIDIPESLVSKMGITPLTFQFLELAEVMGQMNPLFAYASLHPTLSPNNALDQYVSAVAINGADSQQPNPSGPRTPHFPMGVSPAQAHLQLPDGSPRVIGSPAQAPNMQLQQSQHGTSSSGPSANTSPNASNKRRRPSVKDEIDVQVNGNPSKTAVKPSPRIGGKRQKGNPV